MAHSSQFIAHTVPGLESLAEEEIERSGGSVTRTLTRFDERTSLLSFTFGGEVKYLLRLGTVEDVFSLAAERDGVPWNRGGLMAIRSYVAQSRDLENAVSVALRARPHRRGKVGFRVIARKSGEHAFRRVDLQRAVEHGILDRFPRWRVVEDGGLEVWAQLVNELLITAIRISDNDMRQRTYRAISRPAALKPTVARGLVWLSEPRDDDVFLDPMCGSGTILIERALAGRYGLLLGGDIDPEAVAATRQNIGPRYKPVEIRQWDARSLPLEDHSVSVIVTNLPFGKQIGSSSANRMLYPDLLAEWVRVLSPGGRMVLLTSDDRLMRRTLSRSLTLRVTRQLQLLVRGQPATAYVIRSSSV